jgi:hypothetical protein
MRISEIKQNCCRVRVCKEHTQYHILGLLVFLSSHLVNLAIGEVLLPLRAPLLTSSQVWLLGGTILSHVAGKPHLKLRQKRDFPNRQHSAWVELPNEKPVAHSAWAATELNELLATVIGTMDIRKAASEGAVLDCAVSFEFVYRVLSGG